MTAAMTMQRQAKVVAACVALAQVVAMSGHQGRVFAPLDWEHPLDELWVRAALLLPAVAH